MQKQKKSTAKVDAKSQKKLSRNAPQGSSMKNANQFLHFISNPAINGNDLEWALGLRRNHPKVNLENIPNRAFAVAYKTLKSSGNKHTSADLLPGINVVTYADCLSTLKPASSLINFEASLRESALKQGNTQQKWCSLPKVERHERPLLLKQSSIKKMTAVEKQLAEDTLCNYPKYNEKVVQLRNFNQVKHMVTADLNLSNLGWQTSLRS